MSVRLPLTENYRRREPLLGAPGGGRELRVVLDLAVEGYVHADDLEKVELLRGLLASNKVKLLEYDERGAPPNATRIGFPGGEAAVGWLEVETEDEPGMTTHRVIYAHSDHVSLAAISGDQARGEILTEDDTYGADDPDDAATRRHDDSVAMAAAIECGADILVTNRPFALSGRWFLSSQMTICSASEALALVGLFLRARSTFVAYATPGAGPTLNMDRGMFFWVGTRALLPSGWRWFSACVESDRGRSDAAMTVLAQSLFQRVSRALRKRDELMLQMSKSQNNDVAEDALTDLDHILVLLVGAFDVLARVAHRAAALNSSERQAGWLRDRWREKLTRTVPNLGALVAEETEGADLLKVLGILRNTVHGAGLQALGLGGISRRDGTAVSLPREESAELVEILKRRGWDRDWGLTRFHEERFHATPDLIVDHVIRASLPLMNAMMDATPVEQLVGASRPLRGDALPQAGSSSPPVGDDLLDPFASRHQTSIRWQLGFD